MLEYYFCDFPCLSVFPWSSKSFLEISWIICQAKHQYTFLWGKILCLVVVSCFLIFLNALFLKGVLLSSHQIAFSLVFAHCIQVSGTFFKTFSEKKKISNLFYGYTHLRFLISFWEGILKKFFLNRNMIYKIGNNESLRNIIMFQNQSYHQSSRPSFNISTFPPNPHLTFLVGK